MKSLRIFVFAGFILAGAASASADYIYSPIVDPMGYQPNGGTEVYGVSGNTVVGSYVDTHHNSYGFSESGGVYTTISDPSGVGSTVIHGISGSTIVGYFSDANGVHGFSETGGIYTTLDDPAAATGGGGRGTYAQAVSGNTVVGYYTDSGNVDHGFSETDGVYTTLDDNNPTTAYGAPVTVTDTEAYGVSGSTIVGTYHVHIGASTVGIAGFTEIGGVFTTTDIIPYAIAGDTIAGWTTQSLSVYPGFTVVGAIETDGAISETSDPSYDEFNYIYGIDGTTIVGDYKTTAGDGFHAFIATLDVPEPASLALLAGGTFFLLLHSRRRP